MPAPSPEIGHSRRQWPAPRPSASGRPAQSAAARRTPSTAVPRWPSSGTAEKTPPALAAGGGPEREKLPLRGGGRGKPPASAPDRYPGPPKRREGGGVAHG